MNAQVDTRPEGGDRLRAPFTGSAVGSADAPSTVLDCLLNLELQYETLQDLRKDTTDLQLEQRWKANRAAYQARREEA